ncbi:hypothetical protein [Alistipes ihumii]|uniref:hypothetical protein n=1 Tax=Alistipes ihumii TaxID=1470347 RepID=UPI003993E6E8
MLCGLSRSSFRAEVKQSDDRIAESRIDYISDHLGIKKEEVISVVNLMREERFWPMQRPDGIHQKKRIPQSVSSDRNGGLLD